MFSSSLSTHLACIPVRVFFEGPACSSTLQNRHHGTRRVQQTHHARDQQVIDGHSLCAQERLRLDELKCASSLISKSCYHLASASNDLDNSQNCTHVRALQHQLLECIPASNVCCCPCCSWRTACIHHYQRCKMDIMVHCLSVANTAVTESH